MRCGRGTGDGLQGRARRHPGAVDHGGHGNRRNLHRSQSSQRRTAEGDPGHDRYALNGYSATENAGEVDYPTGLTTDRTDVNFGYYTPGPTLAIIIGFRSYLDGGQVMVEWQTLAERGTVGFYLERKDTGSDRFERSTRRCCRVCCPRRWAAPTAMRMVGPNRAKDTFTAWWKRSSGAVSGITAPLR